MPGDGPLDWSHLHQSLHHKAFLWDGSSRRDRRDEGGRQIFLDHSGDVEVHEDVAPNLDLKRHHL